MDTKEQRDQQMFGCSGDAILAELKGPVGALMGPEMFAMSILSDAQEMIAQGQGEKARQFINRAKLVLDDTLRAKRKEA